MCYIYSIYTSRSKKYPGIVFLKYDTCRLAYCGNLLVISAFIAYALQISKYLLSMYFIKSIIPIYESNNSLTRKLVRELVPNRMPCAVYTLLVWPAADIGEIVKTIRIGRGVGFSRHKVAISNPYLWKSWAYFLRTYWVTQKLPQICTVILRILIWKVA